MRYRGSWSAVPTIAKTYDFESGIPEGWTSGGSGTGAYVEDRPDVGVGTTKALRFPDINDWESTWVEFTHTFNGIDPLVIRFESSYESYFDKMSVWVSGSRVYLDGGGFGAGFRSVTIPADAGSRLIQLRYEKDGSSSAGEDTCWFSRLTGTQPAPSDAYTTGSVVTHNSGLWTLTGKDGTETPGTGTQWTRGATPSLFEPLTPADTTTASTDAYAVKGEVVWCTKNCLLTQLRVQMDTASGKTYRLRVHEMSSTSDSAVVGAAVGQATDVVGTGTAGAWYTAEMTGVNLVRGKRYIFTVAVTDNATSNIRASATSISLSNQHLRMGGVSPSLVLYNSASTFGPGVTMTFTTGTYALSANTVDA